MRRAIARGRVFPQSYSTDRRYGRLSLKACALFPLMWANADDQGRLPGDPEEIKYAVCPNIDHITKADIPELLEELDKNNLIKVYTTSKTKAIQILDWWDVHRPQWAWPSQYSPPEGWQDHLRYKKSAKEVATFNWFSQVSPQVSEHNSSGESSGEPTAEQLGEEIRMTLSALPDFRGNLPEHEIIKETLANLGDKLGYTPKEEFTTEDGRIDLCWEDETGQPVAAFEIDAFAPKRNSLKKLERLACPYPFVILRSNPTAFQQQQGISLIGLGRTRAKISIRLDTPPHPETENEKERGKRRGRGNSPESSGEKPPSPSPKASPSEIEILQALTSSFKRRWGRVPAHAPDTIIVREPGAKETAQLRDLAREISSAGGCPLDYTDQAFDEAVSARKLHISYVRAILLDWLGIERVHPP